jgi:hypothetical protein
VPKEGEEALVDAMKDMCVGYLIYYDPTRVTDARSESRNSSPRGLRRNPLPEPLPMLTLLDSRNCWTTPREQWFLAGKQIRRRDIFPRQSFVELRLMTPL